MSKEKCNHCHVEIYEGDSGYYEDLCPDCIEHIWDQEARQLSREYERSVL